MRAVKRIVVAAVVVIVCTASVLLVAVEVRWRRTFDAPYPSIAATRDPAVVERGRYLIYGPAACAYCHVPKDQWPRLDRGEQLPLEGGHLFRLPFGEFYSANLTPDPATGIGRRSDAELARILRHGVRADGRAAVPFMEFQNVSDDDLLAVLSFLRLQPPVARAVPEHRLTLLGKTLMGFVIGPIGPTGTPAAHTPLPLSVARGEYLANHVASCVNCHTDRNERDGSLVGPRFGGGQRMEVADDRTRIYVPPNLTPDPETSPIGMWSEDDFVARMRGGERIPGTPMPWGAYGRMSDDDLRSLYRYFRTLPPYRHETGPRVQPK